jgi:hypothetical protein
MEAGMNYQEAREEEQLRVLLDEKSIDAFIQAATENRQTIIFFPGGMASKLLRATTSFDPNSSKPLDFKDQEIWLSLWTFGHPELNALKLQLHKGDDKIYHDVDDRIIIADGCIELMGLTPYDDLSRWCAANNINLFIFGWDWRQPLGDTVTFFLDKFLPQLNERLRMNNAGPLKNFTLVGHSFGGMILKLILLRGEHLLAGMTRAITVASPFYGTGGQIHRWFEGEPLLNHLGENKIDIIKTLCSLPATYTLNWLEEAIFNENREHLVGDDPFKVKDYPSKDDADPYNLSPPLPDGRFRYSTRLLGFSLEELKNGRAVCQELVNKLPNEELAKKYFNIRGVQGGNGSEPLKQTICGTTWELIKSNFDPRHDPSPITRDELGPGDQVLAAWSTHDAACPSDNRITVQGMLHHSFILSSDEVQQKLGELMGLPASSIKKVNSVGDIHNESLDEKLADDAQEFVQGLKNFFQDPKNTLVVGAHEIVERAVQPGKVLNNVLGAFAAARNISDGERSRISRRIIMSLCR